MKFIYTKKKNKERKDQYYETELGQINLWVSRLEGSLIMS
jgi:hypothetical protein